MLKKIVIAGSALAGLGLACAYAADLPVAVPPAPPGAVAYMEFRNWLWAIEQLLSLAIPALILFTGLGALLRTWCARMAGGRWYLTLALFATVYLILSTILLAPFEYYRDYASLGSMADGTPAQWALGEAVQLGVRIVAAFLFLWIPYALIARSPRRWWLYGAIALMPVALFVLVALPVWVDPLTTNYRPLTDKSLYAEIEGLAARCGVHSIPVMVGGDDTSVVGLGPTNRIILGADLVKQETPSQIRFTVGHELKHYVEGDNYKGLAIICAMLLVGLWLCDRLGRAMVRRFHASFGFSDLADPASLPLLIVILTALWLCVLPFFNLFARSIEHEADRFGLELTHENRAMAEMEVAYIGRDRQAPDWDLFFLIFRATHPSDGERIRFANTYHPWEEGKPLVYGNVCH